MRSMQSASSAASSATINSRIDFGWVFFVVSISCLLFLGSCQMIERTTPPSTRRAAPVTPEASLDETKTTMWAMLY